MADGLEASGILRPLARQVRPLLEVMVPASHGLPDPQLEPLLDRVDARLAQEDPALGRQLGLFVRILWWLPLPLTLRTLGSLSPTQREAFLERLQDGPILKLRLGLWGLRTLLYLGWYGDPARQADLGYRPDPRGWEALP
jgi:hypothetical protein